MITEKGRHVITKKAIVISLVFYLLGASGYVCAVETNIVESDEVIVRYEGPLQNVAENVIDMFPLVRSELEDVFEYSLDIMPTVVLVKDGETFTKLGGNDLVVAFAVSSRDLIVIDNSKMKKHPFTMRVTLKHELCHLLLHHYIRGRHMPRWLDEGISQWVTGAFTEIVTDGNKDLLKQATLSGRLLRMRDLDKTFPQDKKRFQLAYQQSRSFVGYMYNEFGSAGMLRILKRLRDGKEIERAIFLSVSVPLDELESGWHRSLRKNVTWFTYVSQHLYQVLFSLSALLMIYAFIRFLIRKKAYKDEEEDDIIDRNIPEEKRDGYGSE